MLFTVIQYVIFDLIVAAPLQMTVTRWKNMPVWSSWKSILNRVVALHLKNALRWWCWFKF